MRLAGAGFHLAVAAQEPRMAFEVIGLIVAARANERVAIRALSVLRQVLTDIDARDIGGDRRELSD